MAQHIHPTDTIEGTVERIVFHNPSNGWTVLRLSSGEGVQINTVVGHFQRLTPGERLRFTGQWTVDPRHGRQFSADTCLPLTPDTLAGLEKFLGSGLVPGVGPVMAKRIVKQFGEHALEMIETTPNRLAEVEGIGPKRVDAIRKAIIAKKDIQDVMVFLESAGISPAFANRIHRRYGNDAIRRVSENPFQLAVDIPGIGFSSADRIAAHLGIAADSAHRAAAGVRHTLEALAKEGHVYAVQDRLIDRAQMLLNIDRSGLIRALEHLVSMGAVRREGTGDAAAIYLPRLHRAEATGAAMLIRLLDTDARPLPLNHDDAVRIAEQETKLVFAPEQRSAFAALNDAKLTVLTGGPGTGKTTLLRGLVAFLESARFSVSLAAPTGRAAKRMAQATGRDAQTLHRLLEFSPVTARFERNASNPLDADVAIVDEVSMVDIELFCALLEALRPTARLLAVGDPDQLPSVGPGSVLADLLTLGRTASPKLRVVALSEIFRQARKSLIITGAHDVLAGREPRTGDKGTTADLFMVEREDPQACVDVIKALVAQRIPQRFGLDPIEDIQVLCPMHKGVLGATNINQVLQDLLNPEQMPGTAVGPFRVGDKVMQVRNNYDLEVFNGDIGKATGVDGDLEWIEVTFPERTVRYPKSELGELTLAYACSIHKSQGSEYPAVIIPLHTQHFVMLERNLLYTALTRGKQLVVLVGTKRAVRIAVQNKRQTERASGLVNRVRRKGSGTLPDSTDAANPNCIP
ncbi:MAG: ATP-dependent RecD-like DNA helicase [Myxococcota bacterium]|nr:ATP-dependent RecD-like DNA helicase [Myxococcota bacterium]